MRIGVGLDQRLGLDPAAGPEQGAQGAGAEAVEGGALHTAVRVRLPPFLQGPLGEGGEGEPATWRQQALQSDERGAEVAEPLEGQARADQVEAPAG